MNCAKVMDHQRIEELNMLVQRYRDFGMKASCFILNDEGKKFSGYHCYVSEYLDYRTAENITGPALMKLMQERLVLVSQFAQKYKNVPLTEIMSMYSLFDLSPYDQRVGIDEKQQNLNDLILVSDKHGEYDLIEIEDVYEALLAYESKGEFQILRYLEADEKRQSELDEMMAYFL